jgi:hypothetical protein
MAYDSTNGTVILFGGKGNRSQYFNDTWAYTPATNTWHELTPTSILPPGRFGHSIVYDPARRELLLFGGVVGTTGQSANDLWAYSFKTNTWTHLHPADAGPAQARRLRPGAGRQPGKRQRLAAAVARRPPAGTYPSPLQPRSARATRPDRDGQRNGHAHRLNQPAPASPVRSS